MLEDQHESHVSHVSNLRPCLEPEMQKSALWLTLPPVGSGQYVSSAEIHKNNTKVLIPSDWKLKLLIIYIFKKITIILDKWYVYFC